MSARHFLSISDLDSEELVHLINISLAIAKGDNSKSRPLEGKTVGIYPCYGLAEATLLVSAKANHGAAVVKALSAKELEHNRVVEQLPDQEGTRLLVSCGAGAAGHRIVIVDPETLTECSPGAIGEIWVSGPSIAEGYWNRADATEQTFRARLKGRDEGPFLRTGDLGFIQDGELFVAGRLKDLIIIRGLNHYPQDIEISVERCDPSLRPASGAAAVC
jgi:acyl-CoA synthetase (AMP-forming)/AMP-acid ligase II